MTQVQQVAGAAVASSPNLQTLDSPRGWVAVGTGFVALGVAFGVTYSFGAFVTSFMSAFDATSAAVGAVFSIATFIFLMLGAVTGPLCDHFGPRYLVAAAAALIGGGLFATSLVDDLRWTYFTYAGCVGAGVGCVFVPVVSNVGAWFMRQRATALGIAVSGVGLGTLFGAPTAALAIETHGWRTALAGMGAVAAAALLLVAFLIPAAPASAAAAVAAKGRVREFFRDRVFLIMYAAGICSGLAVYVPIVFLAPFAEGLDVSRVEAAALVSAVGVASIGARLLFGTLGDRLSVLGAYKLANALVALSYVVWLFSQSYGGLLAVAVVLGVGYGGCVALTPAVLATFFGRDKLGSVMGISYTSTSMGALLGAPLAGSLITASGGYTAAIVLFMSIGAVGAVLIGILREPRVAAAS